MVNVSGMEVESRGTSEPPEDHSPPVIAITAATPLGGALRSGASAFPGCPTRSLSGTSMPDPHPDRSSVDLTPVVPPRAPPPPPQAIFMDRDHIVPRVTASEALTPGSLWKSEAGPLIRVYESHIDWPDGRSRGDNTLERTPEGDVILQGACVVKMTGRQRVEWEDGDIWDIVETSAQAAEQQPPAPGSLAADSSPTQASATRKRACTFQDFGSSPPGSLSRRASQPNIPRQVTDPGNFASMASRRATLPSFQRSTAPPEGPTRSASVLSHNSQGFTSQSLRSPPQFDITAPDGNRIASGVSFAQSELPNQKAVSNLSFAPSEIPQQKAVANLSFAPSEIPQQKSVMSLSFAPSEVPQPEATDSPPPRASLPRARASSTVQFSEADMARGGLRGSILSRGGFPQRAATSISFSPSESPPPRSPSQDRGSLQRSSTLHYQRSPSREECNELPRASTVVLQGGSIVGDTGAPQSVTPVREPTDEFFPRASTSYVPRPSTLQFLKAKELIGDGRDPVQRKPSVQTYRGPRPTEASEANISFVGMKEENDALQWEVERLRAELSKNSEQLEVVRHEAGRQQAVVSSVEPQLHRLRGEAAQMRSVAAMAQAEADRLRSELAQTRSAQTVSSARNDSAEQELHVLRSKVAELNSQLASRPVHEAEVSPTSRPPPPAYRPPAPESELEDEVGMLRSAVALLEQDKAKHRIESAKLRSRVADFENSRSWGSSLGCSPMPLRDAVALGRAHLAARSRSASPSGSAWRSRSGASAASGASLLTIDSRSVIRSETRPPRYVLPFSGVAL
eukprot:Hpha_TRINITY_DN10645_c0_g1::TRINITY_DN10645_c0_g1_i1::g.156675::m.156675